MFKNLYCEKCGEPFSRAALAALMVDFGAQTNVDPCECPEGGDHSFIECKDNTDD